MKKTLTEILWEELKESFAYRCQGIAEDKIHGMWQDYQLKIIHRVGEEKK